MSAAGQIIRGRVEEVPRQGRTTKGVRLMRLNEGDNVVSMAFLGEDESIPDME